MSESLFFAILPDEATSLTLAQRTAVTCRKYGFQSRPIATGRLHISLLNIGSYDPQRVELARAVAEKIKAAPFDVRFERALSFRQRDRCPFVLTGDTGLAALRLFAHTLRAAFGVPASASFTPHLTLLWDRKRVAPHDIQPVGWPVREFALVRSFVGQSRYEFLGRWSLLSCASHFSEGNPVHFHAHI